LVPMFTVLIAIALGQLPSAPQLFGALLVITGVMVTVYNRNMLSSQSAAPATKPPFGLLRKVSSKRNIWPKY